MEVAEYSLMDAAEAHMWWYRALHARLLTALRGIGPVLDAGCGTGGLLMRLPAACAAIGLEYHHPAAVRARDKAKRPVVCGSVNDLPFADDVFGQVISADVICHAAVEPVQALSEMRRVLRPGGRLILNLPAYQWMHSAHDRRVQNARRFTCKSAAKMLEDAGFSVVQGRYWNSLLFPLMAAQRLLLARSETARSDVTDFPLWQERLFFGMTEFERRLPFALPFGGSLLMVAEKPTR